MHAQHPLPYSAALALTLLALWPAQASAQSTPLPEFARAGFQLQFYSGAATLDVEEIGHKSSQELEETLALSLGGYGMLGILDGVDVGLSLFLTPGAELTADNSNTFPVGTQLDLDVRAGYRLPLGELSLEGHVEGGLSFLSLDEEHGTAQDGERLYGPTDRFTQDQTPLAGWNVGGGVQLGYKLIPLMRLILGLDLNHYQIGAFSARDPDPTINDSESRLKVDLSGLRTKLSLGLEFSL